MLKAITKALVSVAELEDPGRTLHGTICVDEGSENTDCKIVNSRLDKQFSMECGSLTDCKSSWPSGPPDRKAQEEKLKHTARIHQLHNSHHSCFHSDTVFCSAAWPRRLALCSGKTSHQPLPAFTCHLIQHQRSPANYRLDSLLRFLKMSWKVLDKANQPKIENVSSE